jgi:hypothetical protein
MQWRAPVERRRLQLDFVVGRVLWRVAHAVWRVGVWLRLLLAMKSTCFRFATNSKLVENFNIQLKYHSFSN